MVRRVPVRCGPRGGGGEGLEAPHVRGAVCGDPTKWCVFNLRLGRSGHRCRVSIPDYDNPAETAELAEWCRTTLLRAASDELALEGLDHKSREKLWTQKSWEVRRGRNEGDAPEVVDGPTDITTEENVNAVQLAEACMPLGDAYYSRDLKRRAVLGVLVYGLGVEEVSRSVECHRRSTVAGWVREFLVRLWVSGVSSPLLRRKGIDARKVGAERKWLP